MPSDSLSCPPRFPYTLEQVSPVHHHPLVVSALPLMVLAQLAVEEVLLVLELLRPTDVFEDKLVEGGAKDFTVRRDEGQGLLEAVVQREAITLRMEDNLKENKFVLAIKLLLQLPYIDMQYYIPSHP